MKTKIATSIDQSKKLIALGLDPETADMYWYGEHICSVGVPDNYEQVSKYITPCWSLAALLGVLPEPYQLTSNKEGKVQLMLIHHLEKDYYDNPVDACVAMIEKLYELKML